MKNGSSKLDLPCFFRERLLRTVSFSGSLESIEPDLKRERVGRVPEDILRWADDGGQMLDLGNQIDPRASDLALKQANEE